MLPPIKLYKLLDLRVSYKYTLEETMVFSTRIKFFKENPVFKERAN